MSSFFHAFISNLNGIIFGLLVSPVYPPFVTGSSITTTFFSMRINAKIFTSYHVPKT